MKCYSCLTWPRFSCDCTIPPTLICEDHMIAHQDQEGDHVFLQNDFNFFGLRLHDLIVVRTQFMKAYSKHLKNTKLILKLIIWSGFTAARPQLIKYFSDRIKILKSQSQYSLSKTDFNLPKKLLNGFPRSNYRSPQ